MLNKDDLEVLKGAGRWFMGASDQANGGYKPAVTLDVRGKSPEEIAQIQKVLEKLANAENGTRVVNGTAEKGLQHPQTNSRTTLSIEGGVGLNGIEDIIKVGDALKKSGAGHFEWDDDTRDWSNKTIGKGMKEVEAEKNQPPKEAPKVEAPAKEAPKAAAPALSDSPEKPKMGSPIIHSAAALSGVDADQRVIIKPGALDAAPAPSAPPEKPKMGSPIIHSAAALSGVDADQRVIIRPGVLDAAQGKSKAEPTQTAPTQTAPTQTAPTQTAPTQAAPTQAAPTQTAPTQTAPTQTAPTQTAPTQAAPPQAAPTQAAPVETDQAQPPEGSSSGSSKTPKSETKPPPAEVEAEAETRARSSSYEGRKRAAGSGVGVGMGVYGLTQKLGEGGSAKADLENKETRNLAKAGIAADVAAVAVDGADSVATMQKASKGLQSAAKASRVAAPVGVALSIASGAIDYKIAEKQGNGARAAEAVGGTAGGVAGAAAGGAAGAKAGAAIGAGIGAFFGGVGAVPGAAIGGFLGGVAGAIGGAFVGSEAGKKVADATIKDTLQKKFDDDKKAQAQTQAQTQTQGASPYVEKTPPQRTATAQAPVQNASHSPYVESPKPVDAEKFAKSAPDLGKAFQAASDPARVVTPAPELAANDPNYRVAAGENNRVQMARTL